MLVTNSIALLGKGNRQNKKPYLEEVAINVVAILFSIDMGILDGHSEIMILDVGQKEDFDVKLYDYKENIQKYSIKTGEIEEKNFDQSFL